MDRARLTEAGLDELAIIVTEAQLLAVGEEGAAFFGEQAGDDFYFVVELGVVHDAESDDGAAGTGFGIWRGVDEAGDAGVEDGSGTHGAGFERDVEGAAFITDIFGDEAIVF